MALPARAGRAALALLAAGVLAAGCGGSGGDAGPAALAAGGGRDEGVERAGDRRRPPPATRRAPRGVDAAHARARGPTRVRVLLPAGYRTDPRRRYPVLYLLHGAGRTTVVDPRRRRGAITARAPMIVVMPDGGTDGWYTDWYEGARRVQPRWETYHVGELVPWVDATYRTIAARRGRAVAGLSMGGYGALSYAARHPRTFAAAASFSGALEVGSIDAWGPRSGNEARWRAHLPISIAARLRSLALVVLRTGDGRPGPLDRRGTRPGCDACALERFLRRSNVALHRRLRALGIRHTWDDYGPGTHDWPYWRRDLRETLPGLERVLARA